MSTEEKMGKWKRKPEWKREGKSLNGSHIGREQWRSSNSTSLLKHSPPSMLLRIVSWQLLSISREGESTASPGNLFPCSVIFSVEKFSLMFRCSSFHLLPRVLLLVMTTKSLAPSCWQPPFKYLEELIRSPLRFLEPKQTQLPYPFLIREMSLISFIVLL